MKSEQVIYKIIGKNIRYFREKNGKTQQEIADICDFEKSTLSRIEAGRTNITIKNLYKLSVALGVRIMDLVDINKDLE
ncbi:MAG: helix-turn-helix transcriptional regulator [Paludibacter sp.]|nr:helix-turn-helix transcriptional regulator [Paludibacter sp.]